jgi:hypothetical protein
MTQGTLRTTVKRPTDSTFWDPDSPSSPIYRGTLDPGFVPMRPARLRAVNGASTYTPLLRVPAYRFLRPRLAGVRAAVRGPVPLALRADEAIGSYSGITDGAAIGHLLDAAQWTDPTYRSLATGDTLATFAPDGSKKVLDRVNDLLITERGVFFIAGSGVATYEDRHTRWARLSEATFNDVLVAASSGIDLDNIRNRGSVTDGVTTATWQDDASIQAYGPSDATAIDSPYVLDVAALAGHLALHLPVLAPLQRVTVESDSAATLTAQLTLELQRRITVRQTMSGQPSTDYFIERIQDTIGPQGWLLTSEYLVSKVGAAPLIFDVSTYDSADIFDY